MNSRKIVVGLFGLLIFSATACGTPSETPPAPVESVTATETAKAPLTAKQIHIVEDVQKAIDAAGYSEEGLKQYIIDDEGYSREDVDAAVNSIACDLDWNLEAMQKAQSYNLTDKTEIKNRLLQDGFTEEQAEFGTNPVAQN